MEMIKVLLANEPRMMRDLVSKMISLQEDMEVVGEVYSTFGIPFALQDTGANVIVLSARGDHMPDAVDPLVATYPYLTVLGLAATGAWAYIDRRGRVRQEFVDPSMEEILAALRRAVRLSADPSEPSE